MCLLGRDARRALQKRDGCSLTFHRFGSTISFASLQFSQLRIFRVAFPSYTFSHPPFYTSASSPTPATTMAPKKDTATISVRPDGLAGQKCIITGEIDGMSRKAAEQILINAGATIEKSLNKKVTLVVLGENAGEKKVGTFHPPVPFPLILTSVA